MAIQRQRRWVATFARNPWRNSSGICINIGTRLTDSLIGKNVRITKDYKTPKACRMMLGDNSEVSII